jgi:hypothetical protein
VLADTPASSATSEMDTIRSSLGVEAHRKAVEFRTLELRSSRSNRVGPSEALFRESG